MNRAPTKNDTLKSGHAQARINQILDRVGHGYPRVTSSCDLKKSHSHIGAPKVKMLCPGSIDASGIVVPSLANAGACGSKKNPLSKSSKDGV